MGGVPVIWGGGPRYLGGGLTLHVDAEGAAVLLVLGRHLTAVVAAVAHHHFGDGQLKGVHLGGVINRGN